MGSKLSGPKFCFQVATIFPHILCLKIDRGSLKIVDFEFLTLGVLTPPTNSGIMDLPLNFPAKIAPQPRDQNHRKFGSPNFIKSEITLEAAYLEPDQIYLISIFEVTRDQGSTLDPLLNLPDVF